MLRSIEVSEAEDQEGPLVKSPMSDISEVKLRARDFVAVEPNTHDYSTTESESAHRGPVVSEAECQRIFNRLYSDAIEHREQRTAKAEQKRQEERQREVAECSFSPVIIAGDSNFSPHRARRASLRLYQDADNRRQRRRRIEEETFCRDPYSAAITPSKSVSAISDRLYREAAIRQQKRAELAAKSLSSFSPDCSKSRRSFDTLLNITFPKGTETIECSDQESGWTGYAGKFTVTSDSYHSYSFRSQAVSEANDEDEPSG